MPELSQIFGEAASLERVDTAARLVANDRELLQDLVALRKAKHLTQADVAAQCGVSQPTIAAFERYDSDPKLSTIRRYAWAIGAIVEHATLDEDHDWDRNVHWVTGSSALFVKLEAPPASADLSRAPLITHYAPVA